MIDGGRSPRPEGPLARSSSLGDPLEIDEMRAALDAAGVGVWEYDPSTNATRRSGAYDAIYGYPGGYPGDWDDQTCFSHILEADRDRVAAAWTEAITEGRPLHCTYRIRRASDGETRWLEATGALRPEGHGSAPCFVGTLSDITDQHEREESQEVLLGEMRHRVKNILANVQALAVNTGRGSASIDAFLGAFGGRLSALARAHDLAVSQAGSGASVTAIMRAALAPWARTGQISFSGTADEATARQAVGLSLALHELATNATKHGALSCESGRVSVTAHLEEPASPRGGWIELTWQEHGGPGCAPPERQGFGSRLLRQAVPVELSGSLTLSFPPEGLRCVMRFPVTAPAMLRAS